MSASQWTEAEWSAAVRYAGEHDGEFREPNTPLPLSESELNQLLRQVEAERQRQDYSEQQRTVDWAMERVAGRNTP